MTEIIRRIKNEVQKIIFPDIVLIFFVTLSGAGNVFEEIYPFGISCIAGLFICDFAPWSMIFVLLGRIMMGLDASCLRQLLCAFLMVGASYKKTFFKTTKKGMISTAVCMLISDIIYGAFSDFTLYFTAVSVLEIIVTMLLIPQYECVAKYYTVRKIRKTVSQKELTALSVVLCGCLSGLSKCYLPFGISFTGIISIFILFFSAYNFSLGVCGVLGTVLGVLASIASPEMVYSIGSYSVAAIVCCMFKHYGKAGIILSFILSNAVITFYVNGSERVLINLYEILIAGGLFLMISTTKLKQAKEKIMILLDRKPYHESARINSFKDITYKRLNRISDALSVLSVSMQKTGKKQHKMDEETLNMLLDNIKSRVCAKCMHKEKCISNGGETDEMIKNLILMTEKRGWVEQYDVPLYFKNRCLDFMRLVLESNKVYELYRVNCVWENRIAENRELISGQLKDVSGVMKNLADELYDTLNFEDELEKSIITILDGLGIEVENVQVTKNFSNRFSVYINVVNCNGKQVCSREISTVLKKVTGKTFAFQKRSCDTEKCRLHFKEQENFGVEIGVSRIRPDGENKSGDSYAIIRPEGGKVVIALSDGMGTGERAAKESGETVSLLEHLLLAGIDRECAIKLINSVLILKSYDESFATLDLFISDMYTGEAEFIKTGSAVSYICREGQIARISASTLPTGIIGEMETANTKILLYTGDVIMLASDGVTDVCRDDKWICDLLKDNLYNSAQNIADTVMKEALRRVLHCRDDMTVLIIKIFEK